MFLERNTGERTSWKYPYKGIELLAQSQKMLITENYKLEQARSELTAILEDRSVSINSKKIDELKNELEKLGESVERFKVWIACFSRESERVFNLSMSDVVYFGLHE